MIHRIARSRGRLNGGNVSRDRAWCLPKLASAFLQCGTGRGWFKVLVRALAVPEACPEANPLQGSQVPSRPFTSLRSRGPCFETLVHHPTPLCLFTNSLFPYLSANCFLTSFYFSFFIPLEHRPIAPFGRSVPLHSFSF